LSARFTASTILIAIAKKEAKFEYATGLDPSTPRSNSSEKMIRL
jgi:hypothetical protein